MGEITESKSEAQTSGRNKEQEGRNHGDPPSEGKIRKENDQAPPQDKGRTKEFRNERSHESWGGKEKVPRWDFGRGGLSGLRRGSKMSKWATRGVSNTKESERRERERAKFED